MSDRHLPEPAPISRGGRVELRLRLPEEPGHVVYEGRFFTSSDAWTEGAATITLGPPLVVSVDAPGAPEWLVAFTEALLKTLSRTVAQTGFPRRLTRWRPAPDAPVDDE